MAPLLYCAIKYSFSSLDIKDKFSNFQTHPFSKNHSENNLQHLANKLQFLSNIYKIKDILFLVQRMKSALSSTSFEIPTLFSC